MEHRAKIIGATLLCLACASQALTLGRIRGAALLGKPLNVVVPIQMDAGEDAASLCFSADVFHANARQEASRVRVLIEATAQAQLANLRILSSALVDEPVVTVYLNTGCGQKTTHRYVLLADLPSEVDVPSAPPVPAAKTKTALASTQSVESDAANKRVKVKTARVSSNSTPINKKVEQVKGQSKLKLDSLELLSDRIANLDSFMTFAPTEDTLRNLQKMQILEGDVKALRSAASKNEVSLLDLKTRLQKAESERLPRALIYSLAVLLLASLATLAYLWSRLRPVQASAVKTWADSIAAKQASAVAESAVFERLDGSNSLPENNVNMTEMTHPTLDDPIATEVLQRSIDRAPLAAKPSAPRDLDLSDLFGHSAFSLVSAPALAKPPLLPDEPTAEDQAGHTTAPQGSSNLIDFDLPQTSKQTKVQIKHRVL